MKKYNTLGTFNRKGIAFFVILAFAWFQFSLADDSSLNYFEDLDKDGLTNQEEEALGTDPNNADTDGDGYSDGVELESGFDPLIKNEEIEGVVKGEVESSEEGEEEEGVTTESTEENSEEEDSTEEEGTTTENEVGEEVNATEVFIENIKEAKEDELELLNQVAVDQEILEVIQESGDENKYSLTEEEVKEIVETTVQEVNLDDELEIISEEELNIQEEVTEQNDETLEEEKAAVEEYFVQVGYIMFEEAPFLFQDSGNMMGVATTLITGMGADIEDGDSSNLTDMKGKSESVYEKIKELEVPYVLKDVHKMGLSLQKYMIGQDETLATDKDDPVALTSMLGKVQAVMSEVDVLGEDTLGILDEFDIDNFDISDIAGITGVSGSDTTDLQELVEGASMYGL